MRSKLPWIVAPCAALAAICAAGSSLQAQSATPLPADFRGAISYEGAFSLRIDNAGAGGRAGPRPGSRDTNGKVAVEVTYNGPSVVATFVSPAGPGKLIGTRSGATCTMQSYQTGGGTFRCDAGQFSGTLDLAQRTRSLHTEMITRATALVSNSALPGAPANAVRGTPPRNLANAYNGRMICAGVMRPVRLRIKEGGVGSVTFATPGGDASFDIRAIEGADRTIHIRPASKLHTTSYLARRYQLDTFAINLRRSGDRLYGLPSRADCDQIALAPERDGGLPLSAEDFNRLAELLVRDAMVRRPDLSADCGREGC